MTDLGNTRAPTPPAQAGHGAARTTLATGALGIGSAALLGIAAMVGPYQVHVLAVAVICLLGTALIMWRQRRARACGAARSRRRPVLDRVTRIAIVLAVGQLVLTFWMEPPL